MPQTSLLRRLWEGWKRVGRKIGDFQARVLLTLIYAIFVLPFGVVVTLLGDPLRIRRSRQQWQEHPRPGVSEDERDAGLTGLGQRRGIHRDAAQRVAGRPPDDRQVDAKPRDRDAGCLGE